MPGLGRLLVDPAVRPWILAVIGASVAFVAVQTRKQTDGGPPEVCHLLPWVGSAMEMGTDPDKFFRTAESRLGPVFKVTALGTQMIFVTSPSLISSIYRDPELFDFNAVRGEIGVQVFGIPRRLADSPFLAEYYRMHHSKLLPQAISVTLRDYTTLVVEGIQTAVDANGPKTTPLQSFILPTVYNVGARALFGRAFPAESTYAPYLKFDEAVPLIATGLPAFLSCSPRRSFDEVIDVIESYLQQPHPDASELVRATEADAPATGWSQRDIAHALACDLWAAETNTSWTAYWAIALMLQRPEGLAPLHLELEHARAQWSLMHSDTSPVGHADSMHEWIMSSELPLLKSAIEETLRFTTYSFSNRTATRETTISGYKIKPGDNLLLMTRLTHLDEDIHQDAETFRPDRYLNVSAKRFVKNGKPVPNHTMPWGGGTRMCEGRHLALGELKIFIAALLTMVTLEVAPDSTFPGMSMDRIGFGVVHARGDVHVALRRRS